MKLITIQHKNVLDQLLASNKYIATRRVENFLQSAYNTLKKEYNYKNNPVFACPIGRYSEFMGADIEGTYLIELDVPNEFVKLQNYYEWSDLIYFSESPEDWDSDLLSLKNFIKETLAGNETESEDDVIQVTLPYIDPAWVVSSHKITGKFIDKHIGSGGTNILKELDYYI